MARSLDSNIYGTDNNDFASRVASESLSPGGAEEDYWGSAQQDTAQSLANVGKESVGPTSPKTPITRGQSAGSKADNEKLDFTADHAPEIDGNRHRKGPTDSGGFAGYESKFVPRSQRATRKGGSPKP